MGKYTNSPVTFTTGENIDDALVIAKNTLEEAGKEAAAAAEEEEGRQGEESFSDSQGGQAPAPNR